MQTTKLSDGAGGRMTTHTPCCGFEAKLSPVIRFTFKSCRGCDVVYNVTVDLETDTATWEPRAEAML